MKLGRLDLSLHATILAAVLAVVALVDVGLFVGRASQRTVGRLVEAIRLSQVAGTDAALDEGIGQCQALLSADPQSVPARLCLATFYYQRAKLGQRRNAASAQKDFEEARKAYADAAAMPTARAEEKALACVGAGAAVFAACKDGEQATGAAAAAEWFRKALQEQKDCADAQVALAVTLLWQKSASAPDEALGLLKAAENPDAPPGREAAVQLYSARGVALVLKGQPDEAEKAFEADLALEPEWKLPRENQRRAALAALTLPGVKLDARKALLKRYESRLAEFGADEVRAANALALAWWRTQEDVPIQTYLAEGYPQALKLLADTRQRFPKDPEAYRNAVAIYEERLYGPLAGALVPQLPSELFDPCAGLEKTVNPWLETPAVPTAAEQKGTKELRQSLADTAGAEQGVLKEMLAKAPLDEAQALDAKLRMLQCQLLLHLRATEATEKRTTLETLARAAEALKTDAGADPRVLRAYAHVMLRQRKYAAAAAALRQAREKGEASAELTTALSQMSEPLKLVDLRPARGGWFGRQPVAGATLWAPRSPGGLQGALTYDGHQTDARLIGSQILYLVPESALAGGTHRVEVQASDGYGNQASEHFELYVDKTPPKAEVTPPDDQPVPGPLPVWTFHLTDEASGVDLETVQINLQSAAEGATPCRLLLVSRGLYQREMPNLKLKPNDRLAGETFQVSSSLDLGPGQYALKLSFADKAGNRFEKTRVYRVAQ